MKKQYLKILSLLAISTLIVGCRSNRGSSSESSSESSSTEQAQEIDNTFAAFLSGTGVSIAYLPVASDWEAEPLYYYSNQLYYVNAICTGTQSMETEYDAKIKANTSLVSYNDDTYTVEDYGYIYVDDEDDPKVQLNFYYIEGYFVATVYRYDGLAGTLDVSKVDTSWYVDYVNIYGYEKTTSLPMSEIKSFLSATSDIPSPSSNVFVYIAYEADEDYSMEVSVYAEGDITSAYAGALETAGYTVRSEEVTTIDWSTWEYVTYTEYTAFDANHSVAISFETTDSGVSTGISYKQFSDVYVDTLTSNTDWTDEEKTTQTNYFGEVLPFMAFGSDYAFDDSYYDWYGDVDVVDTYYVNLTSNYASLLTENGFTLVTDESDDYYGCYRKDNKVHTLNVNLYYSLGNHVEVYVDDSSYIAATAITLNRTSVSAVAGYTFDLTYELTPSDATCAVTWSTSDAAVVTVNDEGQVNIPTSAVEGATATVTATTEDGLSASCTVTVMANAITDLSVEETAEIEIGKTYQLNAEIVPLGASGTITYESSDTSKASVSETGLVTLTDSAAIGDTFSITVKAGEIVKTCACTVTEVQGYKKVTTALDDYSGQYLIVYDGKALNGALAAGSVDAVNNYIAVTIENDMIARSETNDAAAFTFAAVTGGYTIQSSQGYYIGNPTDSNKLKTDAADVNTISVSEGVATILSSGGAHLAFNTEATQLRFRYYKSASAVTANVELYKLA